MDKGGKRGALKPMARRAKTWHLVHDDIHEPHARGIQVVYDVGP